MGLVIGFLVIAVSIGILLLDFELPAELKGFIFYAQVCTIVYLCAHVYTHPMHKHTHTHTHTHMHIHTHAHTHTHTHTHYTRTHTTHAHTHTHTHTYGTRGVTFC